MALNILKRGIKLVLVSQCYKVTKYYEKSRQDKTVADQAK